jgi:uncharacterized membrane protein (DUF2068 family)
VLLHEALLGRLDSLAARLADWFSRQEAFHGLAGAISHFISREFTHDHLVWGVSLLGLDAGLSATEGLGLHYRQRWAAWLAVVATSALMPLEAWSLVRHPTPLRLALLLINGAIVAYLAARVLHHHRRLAPG